MVNVNAYHKEGFYFVFYDTIRETAMRRHVHKTNQNGGFVHVGLNGDCSRNVSNRQTTYGAACVFYCINQDQ